MSQVKNKEILNNIPDDFIELKIAPKYYINKNGEILSTSNGKIKKLNPYKLNTGYLQYRLNKQRLLLHRLIALEFIYPFYEAVKLNLVVNHKDGNKLNNNIDNLEWVTFNENLEHAFVTKLNKRTPVIGINILTGEHKKFKSIMEASKETKSQTSHICECISGKRKQTNNFIWNVYENY